MSSWNLSGWDSYESDITASTDPTKGTTTSDVTIFLLFGPCLMMSHHYVQTGAGTAGSGDYEWSLPDGMSIDLTLQPVGAVVGTCVGVIPASKHLHGVVQVQSATTLRLIIADDAITSGESLKVVSSTWFPLSEASIKYMFNATLALV